MASLQKTQSRISSVETTKKITKAMELVSSSKLRRAKIFHESIQQYTQAICETFESTYNRISPNELPFKFNQGDKKLYILLTSDLGLCGAYNANVAKLLKSLIKPEDKVIIVGSKGHIFLKNFLQESQVIRVYSKLGYDINFEIIARLKARILKSITKFNISSVNVIYTRHINSVSLEATNKQIFPLITSQTTMSPTLKNAEFEPSETVILQNILPLYLGAILLDLASESKVSEMSSRMNAMKNASNNADEITSYLKLVYNKTRQSNITQEINEIVAGSLEK